MLTKNRGGRPPHPNRVWNQALTEGRTVADKREIYNMRHGKPGVMSQEELSIRAGVSRSTVGSAESGHRPMTPETLRRIATALECDPREIRFSYQPALELV
ncbi:helix-turn-helix domain-containing protein [Arthrobacter sp. MDT1-65]